MEFAASNGKLCVLTRKFVFSVLEVLVVFTAKYFLLAVWNSCRDESIVYDTPAIESAFRTNLKV